MPRAQKAAPPAPAGSQADEGAIGSALATARGAEQDARAELAVQIFELGQQAGAIRMARLTRNFLAAGEIRLWEQVKESKKYKDLPIRHPDGKARPARTIEEFTQVVFGISYAAMHEQSVSLEALGEESYQLATGLGLNRAALRAVRALPPEKLSLVQSAIAKGAAKAEVLAVIEDLAERAAQVQEQLDERTAELEVSNNQRTKQRQRIDKLETEKRRFEKLPPDEQLAEYQRDATNAMNEARGVIRGQLRQAVLTIVNHGEERDQHNRFLAGVLAEVQADLKALRDEFQLADQSFEELPEWLHDDEEAVRLWEQSTGRKLARRAAK